ncbi:conserved Plasmodium protein, unknown function [Plasmodium knowlesi strain H]|uniref:Uncharacterized protein n=3 Tax=Plasmodium knowlesi TaxID=5850 RepID=A0A5K1UP59_PLAKH|nr:conserved Plasmodium protein, unknown function [Plasmodium knowlesi strain H]OTN63805.1 Uncharacterized protein PKNOH_S140226200 [Plasmodium knowlesi]CAA9990690.1 conserved Plasmodium protein, unknown function [Plasmodium knowlesi strain H]SBO25918.1 conserved Plasmodium protein, unknown function [Plasmodium knowlesi strain H]SBO28668.1 conserved Plasmodium protein, unknown function [Plasmodium knowlesi strain H]VVS80164.1 conserved Plasmodium protein, unknown function [Plasmodium knowlesi |eukprot:XP_002261980.1 hypothetical protein, conserved in Plasmodium species [Plasmodium knowlesi strain H]
MHPLKNDKLEKISNNELIRRIMELQNSLINISDHMELLKNRNRILDEENEKLENRIRDIVNDVKTELTQKFDKKKSPPFTGAPDIREEDTATESTNCCDKEKYVQREPSKGQSFPTPDSVAPVPTDSSSRYRSTSYGESSLNAHTTNTQSRQHTNCASSNENETKNAQTVFIKNSEQHVNNMSPQKKEGQNFNLLKEHTKNNIYNLLMETEKLNSIFNIASNVLNTSFFSISKEQDGKGKGSQCVQVCRRMVDQRELDKNAQSGDSKFCKLQRNRAEENADTKNYMNFPGGDVPHGGVEVKTTAEGKDNRDIMNSVEIIKEVDVEGDDDIMPEVLSLGENRTGSDMKRAEEEMPKEGERSPDDKMITPLHLHQMEENINGEKDKRDGDHQVDLNTPDQGDIIKRESENALQSDKND